MGRLTSADSSPWSSGSTFTASPHFDLWNVDYDAMGNLRHLRRRDGGAITDDALTYTYAGRSRLTGASDAAGATQAWDSGTLAFQYDANGNMTRIQDVSRSSTWSLTYDEGNRVMSLYEPGMTAFRYRYRYNADGQRYHKQQLPYAAAPGPAQYYALDGSITVGFFGQSSGSWNILTPSGEVIGRMTTGGAASYYLKDHLGSVRAVVNASGAVLETRDYYPYGLEMPGRSYLSGTKAKENFTGHELDAESGLIYAGARYYMPNIGRWTSVDPLADKYPAWSPYNYVLDNPLRFVDPDGRAPVLPWVLRGAWSAYRAYRAGQAAAATASTVVAAHMTAQVLREGMSQVEMGVGAPPISTIGLPAVTPTTVDATAVAVSTSIAEANANPWVGPVDSDVIVVDENGNAIPIKTGEQVTGSPDGTFIQVRDSDGNATGVRKDGPHNPNKHPDPRAQKPHGHRPGVTNPDGTPWLPIKK